MGKSACCGPKRSKGRYYYNNGNYYEGDLSDNIPDGKGILYLSNGEIKYEGNFVNGKKQGLGTYYFDKDFYVIESGEKLYFRKGDYYKGQWSNNAMNGKGTLYLKDGSVKYEGDFVNNKLTGKGKYYFKTGGYYIGQILNNKQHGKGIMYDENGNKIFEGNYIEDKKEGEGKYYFRDGSYCCATFKNNKVHGKGQLYNGNGILMDKLNFIDGNAVDSVPDILDDKFHNF